MANMTVTTVDRAGVILDGRQYKDDVFTFAGADTLAEGTILARDSVSGKLVFYVKGGSTNENGIPKTVIGYEVVAAGAGDVNVRVLADGVVRKDQLIIDADGDASNVDAVVLDGLQDFNIAVESVGDLSVLDNQ